MKRILVGVVFTLIFTGCEVPSAPSNDVVAEGPGCGDPGEACTLFVSNTAVRGDFDVSTNNGIVGDADGNGIEEADTICNADANKPNSGTYKALISDGLTRLACNSSSSCMGSSEGRADWPLLADTTYTRADGTAIMTTDADALFDFSATFTNAIGTTATHVWTGFQSEWMSVPTNNCEDWTRSFGYGVYGESDQASVSSIFSGGELCGNINNLYCVEQP